MMFDIKGLVFDFDGLILETEEPDFKAWQEIYQSFGQELTLSTWIVCIGSDHEIFDPIKDLERLVGHSLDAKEIIDRRQLPRRRQLLEETPMLPGVENYLKDAVKLGLKLGLASSSDKEWVVGHLNRLGILHYFSCIYTSDDVNHVKPDPELYQAAINELQLQPQQAIALEDSPNGILAAKRAGMNCVAIPSALTRNLNFDLADIVLPSMAALPLSKLIAKIQETQTQTRSLSQQPALTD
jgi:HAD superfamily hydrolase (TIGR01509 family)